MMNGNSNGLDGLAYQRAKGRCREALPMAPGLSDGARRVGLLMVEKWSSFTEFVRTGDLVCWPAEETIALHLAMSPSAVRRARRQLCGKKKDGTIDSANRVVTATGNGGRRTATARYVFEQAWIDRTLAGIAERVRSADASEGADVAAAMPADEGGADVLPVEGGGADAHHRGRNPAQEGAQSCTEGGADLHPDSYEARLL